MPNGADGRNILWGLAREIYSQPIKSSTPTAGTSEEDVRDGIGDRQAWAAFEPEEFAGRVDFQKNVPPVGRDDDVNRAVVQDEVVHQAQDSFFDLTRKLVRPPVLNHAEAVAPPVVR